jgi:hypothetical protein
MFTIKPCSHIVNIKRKGHYCPLHLPLFDVTASRNKMNIPAYAPRK